jgi:hypothetical protein
MKVLYGYKILEDGTVLSKRFGTPLSWCDNGKGYMISAISINGVRKAVSHHILVAKAYHGECPEGYEVGHIDDNRRNNHPSNLEYVTKSENNQQSWDNRNRSATGVENSNCKITEDQVREICISLQDQKGCNISKLSRDFKIERGTIQAIKCRRQWIHISQDYIFI